MESPSIPKCSDNIFMLRKHLWILEVRNDKDEVIVEPFCFFKLKIDFAKSILIFYAIQMTIENDTDIQLQKWLENANFNLNDKLLVEMFKNDSTSVCRYEFFEPLVISDRIILDHAVNDPCQRKVIVKFKKYQRTNLLNSVQPGLN